MTYIGYTIIPTDGLVAYYKLDGDATDSSGNGNNGTATNVTWVAAERGYVEEVGSFNGSSSYVDTNFGLPSATGDVSMFGWVNADVITNGLFLSGNDSSATRWDFRLDFNGGSPTWFDGTGGILSGGNTAIAGSWYNLGFIKRGTSRELYINGELVASDSNGSNLSTTDIFISKFPTASSGYFDGKIGDVFIYSKALSQEEINTLYLEGLRQLGQTSELNKSQGFPFYSTTRLQEGEGKVLEISRPQSGGVYGDQSGNGNNGTPTNVTDSTAGVHNVMSFNGSSSFINIISTSLSTLLNGRNPFSVRFSINLNALTAGQIILDTRGSDFNGFFIELDSSAKFKAVRSDGATADTLAICDNAKTTGAWCNLVVTYDGINGQIYANGTPQTGGTSTRTLNSNGDFKIGKGFAGNSSFGFLNGKITEPIIYNRVLTLEEILEDYYSSKII